MNIAHLSLSEYSGIPKILDHPRIIPGWTAYIYPYILGYFNHPRIILGCTELISPLSECPGIPGILRPSEDHPGMNTAHPPPPYRGILGFPGYSDHPRNILGWTELTSSPYVGILGFLGYSRPSQEHPGGVRCVHPRMIQAWSEYPRNPRILRQMGGKLSWDDLRMVKVSQKFRILTKGV